VVEHSRLGVEVAVEVVTTNNRDRQVEWVLGARTVDHSMVGVVVEVVTTNNRDQGVGRHLGARVVDLSTVVIGVGVEVATFSVNKEVTHHQEGDLRQV